MSENLALNDNLAVILRRIIYNKEKYGKDIDDVEIEFQPFFTRNLNEYFHINLEEEDIVAYEVSRLIKFKEQNISQQQIYDALRYMGNKSEFLQLKLRPGVKECTDILSPDAFINNEEYNYYHITSRNEKIYDNYVKNTIQTLRNNGLYVNDNIIFNPKKEKIAKEKNLILFFEDNPKTALKLIKKGIPVVMPKQPWNQETDRDKDNLCENELKEKHELINKLYVHKGTKLFPINDFLQFYEFLKTI